MKYQEARRILRSLARAYSAQGKEKEVRALELGDKAIWELGEIKRKEDKK